MRLERSDLPALVFRARAARPDFLAWFAPQFHPTRLASRARCGDSSALSLTEPNRRRRTTFWSRAEAPRLILASRVLVPFPVARPTVPTVLHRPPHARDR